MKQLPLHQQRERQEVQRKLGRRMAQLRERAGITQEKLSFALGVDRTYISYIERGERNPSLYLLWRIAKALRARFSELANF